MKTDHTKNVDYEALKTIVILAMASILFGFLFHLKSLFILAFLLLAIGIFAKKLSALISSGWLKFAGILGGINTKIILSFVFFILLTPIALVYRVIHGDFMNLKKTSEKQTYFTTREHTYVPHDLAHPW